MCFCLRFWIGADDPRFSKYFQMIRSRVPRSWVERVIEVDDRDPGKVVFSLSRDSFALTFSYVFRRVAILDLDPNKSFASQVGGGETHSTDGIDVDDSTNAMLSGSERGSALSLSIVNEKVASDDDNGAVEADRPPITQIDGDRKGNDDEQSETSTITTLRDTPSSSSVNLNKLGSSLDRIGTQLKKVGKDLDDDKAAAASSTENNYTISSRPLAMEDIEKKMADLLTYSKMSRDGQNDLSSDHQRLLKKSEAEIAKISSLLANTSDKQSDAGGTEPKQVSPEYATLENLPALLSQVMERLELQSTAFEPGKLKKDLPTNKALEALLAKQATLLEEQDSQEKILCKDPEYAKYFKVRVGAKRS